MEFTSISGYQPGVVAAPRPSRPTRLSSPSTRNSTIPISASAAATRRTVTTVEALETYRRSLAMDPNQPEIVEGIKRVKAKLGQ